MNSSPAARQLLVLLYGAGILILADQVADLSATLLAGSPAPGAANWRFGVFGLLMSRASVFLVADVMLWSAALGLGHRGVVRALGMLHLAVAVAVLAALAIFALDWIQVRGRMNAERTRGFDLAALRALLIALLLIGLTGWAGRLALRAGDGRPKGRRADAPPLVTGPREGSPS